MAQHAAIQNTHLLDTCGCHHSKLRSQFRFDGRAYSNRTAPSSSPRCTARRISRLPPACSLAAPQFSMCACCCGVCWSDESRETYTGIKPTPRSPTSRGCIRICSKALVGVLHPTGTHHSNGPRTRACAKSGPWAMTFWSTFAQQASIANALSRSASGILEFPAVVASKLSNCGLHSEASLLTAKFQAAPCQSCSAG